MKPYAAAIAVCLALPISVGKQENQTAPQTHVPAVSSPQIVPASITVHVDYGARLLLVDGQGKKTGYDGATGKNLREIPGAVYSDDSVSDAADESDDPAVAESRVLDLPPNPAGVYLLRVSPTDRNNYQIQFYCSGSGQRSKLTGKDVGIAPGEQHSFSVDSRSGCLSQFVAGAYAAQSTLAEPLLTYALPGSNSVHLKKGLPFRMVVVYDRSIVASTFAATLNGETVRNAFHPKAGGIDAISIPVSAGHNVLQLTVSGTQPGFRAADSFTIDLD